MADDQGTIDSPPWIRTLEFIFHPVTERLMPLITWWIDESRVIFVNPWSVPEHLERLKDRHLEVAVGPEFGSLRIDLATMHWRSLRKKVVRHIGPRKTYAKGPET